MLAALREPLNNMVSAATELKAALAGATADMTGGGGAPRDGGGSRW